VQSSLNQILGRSLRVNGVMNRATRGALRQFQQKEGLPVDGIAGPETEKALIAAKGQLQGIQASELEALEELSLELESFDTESSDEDQFLGLISDEDS
jgi:peptidoglycan hydrolase-like protein with peptidoglycan-binding domain